MARTPGLLTGKPAPAHPIRRERPLPWTDPKPDSEAPGSLYLINATPNSPQYREADGDAELLNSGMACGVRLQLDFQKTETLLQAQGIRHSFVVVGSSTRVTELRAAARRAEMLKAECARAPEDADLARQLRITHRVQENSRHHTIARKFGRLVVCAEVPPGQRPAIVTGGGPDLMEAANRGAHDAGALTVGLNITLPHEQVPNPCQTPGLCFRLHFLLRTRALVVFPGGHCTRDELFETLTLVQTRKIAPMPIILVGQDHWRREFDPGLLVEEGVIGPEDRNLFRFAETAGELRAGIGRWYDRAGRRMLAETGTRGE